MFAYAKTKMQISFAVTAKVISAFVFASQIVQSLCFQNPKFQASSHLLWLYRPVCVGPGLKPRRPVFSQRGSFQDENQKKISSFFQKAAEKQSTASKLFSEVGSKVDKPASKVSPQTSSKSKENKSPSGVVTVISENDDESDEFAPALKKIRSPTFQTKKLKEHKTSPGRVNKQVLGTCKGAGSHSGLDGPKVAEPLVVPETQFFFTPENKLKKGEQKIDELNNSIPDSVKSPTGCSGTDFGIIPDTPDSNDTSVKPKRPLGRSFLLSATSLASNPIQKAKENRQAKLALKKKAALVRKSSGSTLSVEFNKQVPIPKDTEMKTESLVKQFTGSISSIPDAKESDSDMKLLTPDKLENEAAIEDKTPTKLYASSETLSVKRMAKPGISPMSKRMDTEKSAVQVTDKDDTVRILSFDAERKLGDIERKVTNASASMGGFVPASKMKPEPFGDVIEFEKQKQELNKLKREKLEKRRLEILQEKRKKDQEERKKNHEKLLNYQLSGDVRSHKRQSCGNEGAAFVDSVENDDTLEDLLLELNSPSLLKCDSKSKNVNSISKPVSKSVRTGSLGKASIDVGALSDNCDREIICDDMTVLKSKPPVIRQSASLESNDSFGSIAAGWTDEDESFFKEIGMSTETVDLSKTKYLNDTNVNKAVTEDFIDNTDSNLLKQKEEKSCAMEVKHSVKVKPNSKPICTFKNLDSNAKYKSVSSIDAEMEIKEFQSQESSKSISSKGKVENNINLFPTPVNKVMIYIHLLSCFFLQCIQIPITDFYFHL